MDYKKLFVIVKEFCKKDMPDDLMQLTLEFVGDLDESGNDLIHKHSFLQLKTFGTGTVLCSYCKLCNRILCMKSQKELARHVKAKCHQDNISKKYTHISKANLIQLFRIYYSWHSVYRRLDPNLVNVYEIEFKI